MKKYPCLIALALITPLSLCPSPARAHTEGPEHWHFDISLGPGLVILTAFSLLAGLAVYYLLQRRALMNRNDNTRDWRK